LSPRPILFRGLILAARIVGFTAIGIGAAFIINEVARQFISRGWAMMPFEIIWLTLILAMAIAGCVLSWRRIRLAGILLIISGVAMGVDIAIVAGRNQLVWLVIGLPFIITGLFFIKCWRLARPKSKAKA
jgi:hypothetical protein